MSNPYKDPPVPGPYGDRQSAEADKSKPQGQNQDDSHAREAGVAAAIIPQGESAVIANSAISTTRGAQLSSTSGNAVQTAAASAGTQATVLNALGAAHALVNAAIGVIAGAAGGVATAIGIAASTVGPFVVIQVAKSYGIATLQDVQAAANLISGNVELQKALEASISDAMSAFKGQSQTQLLASSDEIVTFLVAKTEANIAASHDLPPTGPTTIAEVRAENGAVDIPLQIQDDGTLQYKILSASVDGFRLVDGHLVHDPFDYESVSGPITVTVQATDAVGHTITQTVTLTVTNVNEAPYVVSIEPVALDENTAGQLRVHIYDPEQRDILVEVPISPQNFEAADFVNVPWSFTDDGGIVIAGVERGRVLDINEAPGEVVGSVTFDGLTLTLALSATDPESGPVTYEVNGLPLAGNELSWSAQQLAVGVPSITILAVDSGGMKGAPLTFDPPKIAQQAALGHPVPPTIIGLDRVQVSENTPDTLYIISWDAIDGLVRTPLHVEGVDYEALGASKAITVHAAVTNSSGLTAESDIIVGVINVNEAPHILGINVTSVPENTGFTVTVTASDPEQGTIHRAYTFSPTNYEAQQSVGLNAVITDAGGLSDARHFDIAVTNANEVFFSGVSTGKLFSHWSGDDIYIGDGGPESGATFMEIHWVTVDGQPLSFGTWAGPVHVSDWKFENGQWTVGIAANEHLDGDFDIGVYANGPAGDITFHAVHVHIL